MIPILDNGHGIETKGKRSPVWEDGSQLFEWEFNRDIVKRTSQLLLKDGIKSIILVPESNDMPLSQRCEIINELCAEYGHNYFVVSVHANAGGGTGWECYTSLGDTTSDVLSEIFCQEAEIIIPEFRMRFDYSDGDADKESDFAILRDTVCPAILTENLFMDNERDCRFIMSEEGRQRIAQLHANAIKKFIDRYV